MELITAGIFDPRSNFGHQALLGIKNITDPGGKRIRESALLEYIQIRSNLKVIDCILTMDLCEIYPSVVNSQTKYIPLPANLKCKIRLFAKSSCIVRQAWGQRNIRLGEAGIRYLA